MGIAASLIVVEFGEKASHNLMVQKAKTIPEAMKGHPQRCMPSALFTGSSKDPTSSLK